MVMRPIAATPALKQLSGQHARGIRPRVRYPPHVGASLSLGLSGRAWDSERLQRPGPEGCRGHVDEGGNVRLCNDPRPPAPAAVLSPRESP
jgi:hypothetical protein